MKCRLCEFLGTNYCIPKRCPMVPHQQSLSPWLKPLVTPLRIRYRFYNFRPMQIKLRDVPLGKPSVSELKTILISWT